MSKTKFADGVNPFTGEKVPKKKRTPIDPAGLQICDDPVIIRRSTSSKYDNVFESLKIGQAVKCQPKESAKIKDALKKWLAKNRKPGVVRHTSCYQADGLGRVWWLEA